MDKRKQRTQDSGGGASFHLGVQTYRDRALLPAGSLSLVTNMRNTYPGIRKRRGMTKLHTATGEGAGWGPILTTTIRASSNYSDEVIAGEGAAGAAWTLATGSVAKTELGLGCNNNTGTKRLWCGVGHYNTTGTGLRWCIGRAVFGWDLQNYTATFPVTSAKFRVYFCQLGTGLETLTATDNPTDVAGNFCITSAVHTNFPVGSDQTSNQWDYKTNTLISDNIISNVGKNVSGQYMEFTFNAAGLSYLNGFISNSYYTTYKFIIYLREYDHDVLDTPTGIADSTVIRFMPQLRDAIFPEPVGSEPRMFGDATPCTRRWFNGYQYVAARQERDLGGSLGIQYQKKVLVQARDGSVTQGTDNPPTVTTGEYGTLVYAPTYSREPLPASFSTLNDILIYSDGRSQHQLWPGPRGRISACVVNSGAFMGVGEDVWEKVVDNDGSWADFSYSAAIADTDEGVLICTPLKASSFTFDLKQFNTSASGAARVDYLNKNGTWTALTGVSDGTVVTDSMDQDGTISWTPAADDIGGMLYGLFGHWYRLRPATAGVWASVEVYHIYYSYADGLTVFQPLTNMFNGVFTPAIEARLVRSGAEQYTFGGTSIDLSLEPETSKLYVGFVDQPMELYIDVGETPNSSGIATTLTFKYWDGYAFQTLTSTDGTAGLTKSGRVTWTQPGLNDDGISYWRPATLGAVLGATGNDNIQLYWVEMTWSVTGTDTDLGDGTNIGFTARPRRTLDSFGDIGLCSTVWKERVCYVFDKYPSYLYVTQNGSVNILNGSDYAVLQAGDGRKNKIVSMRRFHNELLVWQEEHGDEGGCTTLFEGYSPATFGKLLLSSKVGALNAKATVVVDGAAASTKATENFQTKAYWLSRYGVFECDGRLVSRISDPIQNYFDPRFPECIRRGYENEHWIAFDSANYVIRIGIVSGSSATRPNVFLVFDVLRKEWGFDTYATAAKGPVAMFECDTESGNFSALPIALPQDNCWVYLANQGLNDDGDAIDGAARPEINYGGHLFDLRESFARMRGQAGDSADLKVYGNGKELTDEARTLALDVEYTSEEFIRHRIIQGAYQFSNASVLIRNNVVDKDLYLYDYIVDTKIHDNK